MSFAYQWKRNGAAIAGATAQTYVLVAADIGASISGTVTATNTATLSTSVTSAAVGPVTSSSPVNTAAPVIGGTPTQGSILTTSQGTWSNTPTAYAYQWTRAGANIAGATASAYTLLAGDVGANIAVTVTASNAYGTASASAVAVGPVTIAVPYAGYALALDFKQQQYRVGNFLYTNSLSENNIAYSEQFDNAAWAKALCTVTPNTVLAPDGTMTADSLVESATGGGQIALNQNVGFNGGSIAVLSCYFKKVDRDWVQLNGYDGANSYGAYFNLATGVVGTKYGSANASITALANGWYRCAVFITSLNTIRFDIKTTTADNVFVPASTGGQVTYIWGAQAERGSTLRTYIPTTATKYFDRGLATVPGYSYTRSGAKGELNGSAVAIDGPPVLMSPTNPTVANATYVSDATSITLTKTADGASLSFGGSGGLTVGHKYRVRFTLTASERARTGCSDNTNQRTFGAGVFNVDFIWTAAVSGNIGVSFEIADGTAWAANGATMKVDNLIVTEQAPVVTYFGANAPGIVPGIGYWSRGALTNYLLQSQNIVNGSWNVPAYFTATANAAIAPDGTTTATRLLTIGNASSGAQIAQNATGIVTNGAPYTSSIWVKSNTGSTYNLRMRQGWVATVDQTITVDGTWRRVVINRTADATSESLVFGSIVTGDSANFDILVWQGQLINGNFPDGGPIIATTTAAASIGADAMNGIAVPTLTDVDMLFFCEIKVGQVTAGDQYMSELYVDGSNRIALVLANGQVKNSVIMTAGGTVYSGTVPATLTNGTVVTLLIRRLSGAWQAGSYTGGIFTWAPSNIASLPLANKISIGGYNAGPSYEGQATIQKSGLKTGTFATDAAVLTAIS